MTAFPPGAPNFQLPRPHQGVVYADESGSVYLMRGGEVLRLWTPPKPMPINQRDED
jgi:hypothetical protein